MNIIYFDKIKEKIFPSQKLVLVLVSRNEKLVFNASVHSYMKGNLLILGKNKRARMCSVLKREFLIMCEINHSFYGVPFLCDHFVLKESFFEMFLRPIRLEDSSCFKNRYSCSFSEKTGFILCIFESFKEDRFYAKHILEISLLNYVYSYGICIQSNQETFIGSQIYIANDLSENFGLDNTCIVVWKIKNSRKNFMFRYVYGLRFMNKNSSSLRTIRDCILKNIFYDNIL